MAAENAYKYDHTYAGAPAYAPEQNPVTQPKPKKQNQTEIKGIKSKAEDINKQNEVAYTKVFAKAFIVIGVFLALFAVYCNSMASREEAKLKLEKIKESYAYVEAENRELKVEINNLVNAENIDRIAVEELGLVKVAPGNEIYLDTQTGNQVIYSQGK